MFVRKMLVLYFARPMLIWLLALISLGRLTLQAQSIPQSQAKYTGDTPDLNKRSIIEVDPTTLALNITIPLGSYPGRNGGLPISLNYNSKLWQVISTSCSDEGFNPIVRTEKHEVFYGAGSSSGWTSSLRIPYVNIGGEGGYVVRFNSGATYYGPDHAQPAGACPLVDLPICSDPGPGCTAYPWEYFIDKVRLHMPGGTSYELRAGDSATPYPNLNGTIYRAVDGSGIRYEVSTQTVYLPDGSQYRLNTTAGAEYLDRNGNKLNWNRNTQQWTDTLGRTFTDPLDASSQWSLPGQGGSALNYTFVWAGLRNDATGQTVLTNPSNPADPNPWNPGLGQNPLKYTAPHNENLTQFFSDHFFNIESSTAQHNNFIVQGGNNRHNPYVIHQIILPNNQKYTFTYNIYGEIDKVILPAGGYKRYEYGYVPPTSMDANSSMYTQVNRGVVKMWESAKGDGTDEKLWQFIATADGGLGYQVKTIAPNNTFTIRSIYQTVPPNDTFGFSIYGDDILAGRVIHETGYDATGNQLYQKSYGWGLDNGPATPQYVSPGQPIPVQQASRNPRLMAETEYLYQTDGNMVVRKIDYQYDTDLNVIGTTYYADVTVPQGTTQLPLLTPLRIEETIYLTHDATAVLPSGVMLSDYANRNLIRIPSKMIIMDGTRKVLAANEYRYDESAYLAANYSTGVLNWTPPPMARGNVTTVRRWKNYNPSTNSLQTWTATLGSWQTDSEWASGNWLETHSWYDQCGNVVKVRDANSNDTAFKYDDAFCANATCDSTVSSNTYAYQTQTILPVSAAQTLNGLSARYDFSSGKVVKSVDANGQVTALEYTDPIERLTKVIRPSGGGETRYTYCDGSAVGECLAGELSVRVETLQSGSTSNGVWLKDCTLFDKLGRPTRSAHYEGASGWSVRDTEYDALGRAFRTSNPAFVTNYNSSLASPLWTTTTFDALSRVTRVTTPDGSHADTEYFGNKVTVTDQAGKKRSSVTDALGRLIQVNEAPNDPNFNYQTNYTHDVLGNLIRVRQGGFPTGGSPDPTVQFRRFYYDSLSRLVFANNPEQEATIPFNPPNETGVMWTMKYEYDANGNLTKRKDARGVETTYGYDALNRNTTVDYNIGTSDASPTAAVRRYYDMATSGDGGGAFANGKGRLRRVESLNQTHPISGNSANSRTVIDSYDNLGRISSQKQGFQTDSNWQYFTTGRAYDLASHVTIQSYPAPGHNIGYNYTSAGRLNFSDGYLGDGGYRSYTFETKYNAAGQMVKELLGTSVYHHASYNNRFQMVETRVSTNPIDANEWTLGKLRFFYSSYARDNDDPFANGTDNNGNVLRQEHFVPTSVGQKKTGGIYVPVVSNYAVPMRDDYTYDAINRLTRVQGWQRQTGNGTPEQIYQQAYSYDKFGNRKLDAAQTWGNLITGTQPADLYDVNKPTNRLTGMVYDAAGNLRSAQSSLRFDRRDYDAENRMVYAKTGLNPGNYVYDGDGRRVRRIVNGAETWQVYGIDGELLAEYNATSGSPVLQKEYGYRNGQLLVVAEPSPGTVKWLVADHLGTPRIIVDSTGSLSNVRRHDYLPFGEELTVGMGGTQGTPAPIRSTGMGYAADGVRQKFTGYERDDETDLDFAQARYYSNKQGRFTSPDEILFDQDEADPQTWNLYSYVGNNPGSVIDPTGRYKCKADGSCTGDYDGERQGKLYWNDQAQQWISKKEHDARYHARNWSDPNIAPNRLGTGGRIPTGEVPQMVPIVSGYRDFSDSRFGAMMMIITPLPGPKISLASKLVGVNKLFNSFSSMKRFLGPAGAGYAWHHIVEQTPANIQRFGEMAIQNLENVVRLPHGAGSIHARISGYYNSINARVTGSATMTIREWQSTKSFGEQYAFGVQTLRNFGVNL